MDLFALYTHTMPVSIRSSSPERKDRMNTDTIFIRHKLSTTPEILETLRNSNLIQKTLKTDWTNNGVEPIR